MNRQCKPLILSLALAAALGAANPPAFAQTLEQTAAAFDRTAGNDPKRAANKMAEEFSGLVGSEAEALKLIAGLRNGTPVTLGDSAQAPTVAPTSGTGYGNVFISLALTQASLARTGTSSPTSQQLSLALNQVLAQRA